MIDLIRMIIARKRWFLIPILLVCGVVGAMLAFTAAFPVAAPFIYAIF